MTKYENLPRDKKMKAIVVEEVAFPIRYTLMTPVEVDGATRGEIDIHELSVGEIEAASAERNNFRMTVLLVANALRIAPDDVRRLGSRDYANLSRTVSAFY